MHRFANPARFLRLARWLTPVLLLSGLALTAAALGYGALAITDECSLAGVVRAHLEAKTQQLHLVIGSEMRLTLPGSGAPHARLVVLAQTRRGYGNLSHWITVARRRAEAGDLAFGTVDTWLLWKLTEGRLHITDASNASRTLLFNIHTLQWDEELLRALNVPPSVLPEVRSSSEIYGDVTTTLGLESVILGGIAGDRPGQAIGALADQAGVGAMKQNSGDRRVRGAEEALDRARRQLHEAGLAGGGAGACAR